MDTAKLRDGTELKLGDEVTTNFHKNCIGEIFVVCEINPWDICESKTLVVAHLKGSPDRRIKSQFAGRDDRPEGLDANWFKPVKKP